MSISFENLTIQAVRQLAETDGIEALRTITTKTVLLGNGGALDSAGLVFLIVEIEEMVKNEFGVDIVIVDEKAFSGRSPFRTVASLASYLEECVEKAK